jgi:hypothetical protein
MPYGSWHHTDRGRWSRGSGAGPDEMTRAEDHVGHKVRGRDLRTLHVETDGNYSIEGDGTRDNLLEVCRLCGKSLGLLSNSDGRVVRGKGDQPEYCSKRCKADVYNARRRAISRIGKPRAGIEIRLRGEEPPSGGAPLRRPWLYRGARSRGIPRGEILSTLRDGAAFGCVRGLSPDSIARRWGGWQSYWPTTGIVKPGDVPRVLTAKRNALPRDRDRVTQWWRYVHREIHGGVKQVDDKVWCISP